MKAVFTCLKLGMNGCSGKKSIKSRLYRETQSQLIREAVRFTPDGWLDFRITANNQTQQACILLRNGYGHTSETALSEKDRLLCGLYQRGLV